MRLVINEKWDSEGPETGWIVDDRWSIKGCTGPRRFGVDHGRWAEEITLALLRMMKTPSSGKIQGNIELDDVDGENLVWTLKVGEKQINISGRDIQKAEEVIGGSSERKNLTIVLEEIIQEKASQVLPGFIDD
ncbi:MAG: hypothetical protein PHT78_03500 [Desulfitobacteriaceae bacterium]|nr:hypothetical protein [Desulfitobacteriaceae bacterium]MDD4752308.1 hypothetical protein [Desulfitobacteriaceae bacterium]